MSHYETNSRTWQDSHTAPGMERVGRRNARQRKGLETEASMDGTWMGRAQSKARRAHKKALDRSPGR